MPKSPGWNQKFRIQGDAGSLKGYLRVTEGPDHMPIAIALDIHRDGTMGKAMANAWTEAINLALQAGVSLQTIVDTYKGWKFDPSGPVECSHYVTHAESVLDYVVQELEATYLRRAS